MSGVVALLLLAGLPPQGEALVERVARARELREAGELDQALATLADLPGPEASLERGLIAAERGDDALAAEQLERALAAGLGDARVEYRLGRALETLGRLEPAAEAYRRALEQDPGLRSARFRLGSLRLRQGRGEEGRALLDGYESFRQWDRRVKLLRFMLGSGRLPEPERRDKLRQLIGLLLQAGEQDEAGPLISSELARSPGEPGLLVARARWLEAAGRRAEARQALTPLLGTAPTPDALWLAARLDLLEGKALEAADGYDRLLAIDASPPLGALKEAATASAVAGRPGRAEALFRRALERAPAAADLHTDLALLLESLGRFEEARASLERALELEPDQSAARRALQALRARLGGGA